MRSADQLLHPSLEYSLHVAGWCLALPKNEPLHNRELAMDVLPERQSFWPIAIAQEYLARVFPVSVHNFAKFDDFPPFLQGQLAVLTYKALKGRVKLLTSL